MPDHAEGEGGRIARLRIQGPDGEDTLDADACFVFIGASPRTHWLAGVVAHDDRGLILAGRDAQADGWPLPREPYMLETSVPGVFVAGATAPRIVVDRHDGSLGLETSPGRTTFSVWLPLT